MRRVGEAGVWFVLLTGAYLTFIGSVTGPEAATGVAVAAASAALAVLARSAERLRDRPRLAWLGWLPAVPAAVLTDTGRLGVLLARRVAGRAAPGGFADVQLGPAEDRYRPAQRALAMLAISLAPSSYVVAADHERGTLQVHRIGAATSAATRLDRRVGR